MKKIILIGRAIAVGLLSAAMAHVARAQAPAPPPVYQSAPPPATAGQVYVYDQKPLGGMPELIPATQAQAIVDEFKTNYPKLGSPRFLIFVNRELVDEQSGLKLSGRTERVQTTRNENYASTSTNASDIKNSQSTTTTAENHYHSNGKAEPTLADRQTVRDIERLMGRPLRSAGATLADQHVASQLIGDRSLDSLTTDTEQARKDREAVNKIADAVIEVLISSRNVTVAEVSGDKVYTVPDIQMTAIRLKDAKVFGQASAADVMNKSGNAGYVSRNFGVQAITEATTLALMDDMMQETK